MSLQDFIPSLAIAYVIWSILGIFVAILLWIPLNLLKWFCNLFRLNVGIDHILSFAGIFIILGLLSWICKQLLLSNIETSFQLKILVLTSVSIISIYLTWLFQTKTEKWIESINNRLTPLVLIFGLLMIFSLSLVTYVIFFKDSNEKIQAVARDEASSTKPAANKPNIILVTFDGLSPRHMSVYGYKRPTTPFIEKWAQQASIFTKTISDSSYTGATTASLMTGKRTWTHRRFSHEKNDNPIKADIENLARLLKEHDYYNLAFTQNEIAHVESLGISNSFDVYPDSKNFKKAATIVSFIEIFLYELFGNNFLIYNWFGQDTFILNIYLRKIPQNVYVTEYPPEMIFNSALETIDDSAHEPFFAWIHLFPPHIPFLPPKPFVGVFNSSMDMREANIQFFLRTVEYRKYFDNNLPFPDKYKRKLKLLEDYYDEFILYCDREFVIFINELEKRNKLQNTIIILSSDHGETFEPAFPFHAHVNLNEEVTHIPLIIKEPDQMERKVIDNITEQIDIPSTILELADIQVPQWMEGRSLVPLMRGKGLQPRPAFSMALQKTRKRGQIIKGLIAVWEGDYKLLYYLEDGKTLLFNLKKDPGELNNLFNKEPVIGHQLVSLIKNNLKEANKRIVAEE
jgi:arylsulfatase